MAVFNIPIDKIQGMLLKIPYNFNQVKYGN